MATPEKKLSGTQKAITIITIVALTVYSVISIALAANAYDQLDANVDELQAIVNNWQTGTIEDVVVDTSCDTANGYAPAFNDRAWGGVSSGCWCGNADEDDRTANNITCNPFCAATCSSVAIEIGCEEVEGRGAQPFNYLGMDGATGDSLQVCVKRSTETFVNTAFINTEECPEGYLECGTGENRFCTKQSACPITSLSFDISNSGVINGVTKNRGEDVLPLAELTLNQYGMCRLKETSNWDPFRRAFYLYTGDHTSCGKEGDYRWETSGSVNEAILFEANGLTDYIDGLQGYTSDGMLNGYYPTNKDGTDYTYKLFSRSYIPFKIACRSKVESFINKQSFVTDLRTAQLALLIVSIVSVVCLGVPLAWMEIQNLRGVDLTCIKGKGEEERKRLKRIKKIINYIFKGIQLPFQLWAIASCGLAKTLFIDLADDNCSNAETNAVVTYLSTTLTKTYSSTITSLAILVATVLLDIILDIIDKRKTKKDAAKQSPITNREEHVQLANLDNDSSSPLRNGSPTKVSPQQIQPQQVHPQPQAQAGPNIVIQLQPGQMGMPQHYPPQGYPQQQFAPQGYPQQQYPPQGFPQQQYPPQGYPQQQFPPRY